MQGRREDEVIDIKILCDRCKTTVTGTKPLWPFVIYDKEGNQVEKQVCKSCRDYLTDTFNTVRDRV